MAINLEKRILRYDKIIFISFIFNNLGNYCFK